MRIAICDDEKEIRQMLAEKVHALYPQAFLSLYKSGEELLSAEREADIVLLDIQMAEKDGMETAREFRRKNKRTVLIFITALEEYVFQAFDVGAFHYLVKPFEDEKFAEVLGNAVRQAAEGKGSSFKRERAEASGFLIQAGGQHIFVRLEEIVYAEVFNRKIILHTLDADIEYYGKMKELEEKVGEDFYRPHRAYLINFAFVRKYDAATIYLEKGQALMAKQNYPEFVKRYLRYTLRTSRT